MAFIENNILRHYLRNVYIITGTAYAGKSTMVKMLAEKYERWVFAVQKEVAGFEIAELIRLSGTAPDKKIIVDTNMPLDLLKEISDYNHITVMLSPQSMSVERFFDRNDPEKQYILSVINSCENPEQVMEN